MRTSDNKKRLQEIEIFSLEHWIFMFTKVNVMVDSKPLDDRNKLNGLIGSKSCYFFFSLQPINAAYADQMASVFLRFKSSY